LSRRPPTPWAKWLSKLVEHEIHIGAFCSMGAWNHEALDAQLVVIGLVAQAAEFRDV